MTSMKDFLLELKSAFSLTTAFSIAPLLTILTLSLFKKIWTGFSNGSLKTKWNSTLTNALFSKLLSCYTLLITFIKSTIPPFSKPIQLSIWV